MTLAQAEAEGMDDRGPSQVIAALVSSVPGVDAVYAARPVLAAVAAVIGKIVELVTHKETEPEYVTFREGPDGISVDVRIGVDAEESAAEMCRRVHDLIDEHVRETYPGSVESIAVTVARIGS